MDTEEEDPGKEARQAVADGMVSVRTLSRYTTYVLEALQESGKPLLVTRHGFIVARIEATSARELLDALAVVPVDALSDDLRAAIREADEGKLVRRPRISERVRVDGLPEHPHFDWFPASKLIPLE